MKRFQILTTTLIAALALSFAGCGGGGGGGGGGPTPPGNGDGDPGDNTGVVFDRGVLAPLQGSTFSTGIAINDANVAVGIADDIEGDVHAITWTVVGTTPSTPVKLELLPAGTSGAAYDINDAGQVVGESEDADLNIRAVLWQGASGSPMPLPSLPEARFSAAFAISNNGLVVGSSSAPPAADGTVTTHAVFWTVSPAGAVTSAAPTLLGEPAGFVTSSAYFVNDADQVVGEVGRDDGSTSAVLWTLAPAGGATAILLPPLTGHAGSVAFAINELGQVVGESESAEGVKHAILWDVVFAPPVASDLGARATDSTVVAINDSGLIAGWVSAPPGSASTAALWSTAALELAAFDPILATGVSAQAYGINSSGNVVGLSLTDKQAFVGIAR
jgi:probable HAF family extracellular repeat protein